jgi:hypothetical protein
MIPVIKRMTDVYELGVRSISDTIELATSMAIDDSLLGVVVASPVNGLSMDENDDPIAEGSNGEPGAQTEATHIVKQATSAPNPNNPLS